MSVGIDIVEIERIEKLKRHEKFLERIFNIEEIEYIHSKQDSNETIAGMFAAKEAISKVFGTGIGQIAFKDMTILHTENGKPIVQLSAEALLKLKKLGFEDVEISISHEKKYAIATANGINRTYEMKNTITYNPELAMSILKRDKYGHKGNYGRVAIIGGSIGMSGSIYMASLSALRMGSGIVYSIVPKSISIPMQVKSTEAIVIPVEDLGKGRLGESSIPEILERIKNLDAIAIGPGMGNDEGTKKVVEAIINNFDREIVIDADGLNAISDNPNILKKALCNVIVTPHAMEMSRLTKKDIREVVKNKAEVAIHFAKTYQSIVLLKGAETIITDGVMYYFNNTGNPGMATAGSGDILTGIILSLLGQGYKDFLSARLGAYIHGIAGDITATRYGQQGMIATDMIKNIAIATKKLQEHNSNEFD